MSLAVKSCCHALLPAFSGRLLVAITVDGLVGKPFVSETCTLSGCKFVLMPARMMSAIPLSVSSADSLSGLIYMRKLYCVDWWRYSLAPLFLISIVYSERSVLFHQVATGRARYGRRLVGVGWV